MKIIPAIDIKDGQCVRLERARSTPPGPSPLTRCPPPGRFSRRGRRLSTWWTWTGAHRRQANARLVAR